MTSTNFINNYKPTRRFWLLTGAVITLVAPLLIIATSNVSHLDQEQSLCPFKMLTGLPCPGCGITKSLIAIYQNNWLQSFRYHLFGPLALIVSVLIVLDAFFKFPVNQTTIKKLIYSTTLAYTIAIILGIYHLIRLGIFIHNNSIEEILKQSIWK